MQDLLGLRDTKRVKAVSGLAGGIGHKGAACGILTGGAIALSLAAARSEEDQATITARGAMCVNRYADWFVQRAGSTSCRDIIQTDFDDDRQVRKYYLTRSLSCKKLASKAAAFMTDMLNEPDREPEERFFALNAGFGDSGFHCASAGLNETLELLESNQMLGSNLLIPLNGGIGYSGSTCSALLGACIAIGLVRGGDTSEVGVAGAIKRFLFAIFAGTSAFTRIDLSPANDALLRCGKLFEWFQKSYGRCQCRDILGFHFVDREKAADLFANGLEQCKEMATETAARAAELAR